MGRKENPAHIERALNDFRRFNREDSMKWATFECFYFPQNERVILEVGWKHPDGKRERANATYYYFLIRGEVFVHIQGHPC